MVDVLLKDYHPKSELIVPSHVVEKPRFPVIDFHAHLMDVSKSDVNVISEEMSKFGVCSMVNLTGSTGAILFNMMENTNGQERKIVTFSSIDVARLDEPDFGQYVYDAINEAYSKGVRGLKFFKSLSLGVRDSHGKYIPADTPRLIPIWKTAGALNIPVLIHIADPIAFFSPTGPRNERIEELSQHPDWSFTDPEMFTFKQLMEQQEALVAANPETTFVIAHVGSAGEDLAFVADMLSKYHNVYIDIAARISELGRQPYSARKFLVDYQDRVLFGTDIDNGTLMGHGDDIYPYYYRFLETFDEYFDYSPNPIQGRWKIYGVGLPDDVLEKIYWKNAVKLVPDFAECIR